MAKYKEIPCMYYISHGDCFKNRNAVQNKLCQTCDKYKPRAKMHLINKKRAYNNKMRKEV